MPLFGSICLDLGKVLEGILLGGDEILGAIPEVLVKLEVFGNLRVLGQSLWCLLGSAGFWGLFCMILGCTLQGRSPKLTFLGFFF